ncbi:MAG: ACT domain-containing protein [Dysosmobacter sp.]
MLLLAENNVNILDISQTILHGAFTMVMAVDVGGSRASIGELADHAGGSGRQNGHFHPHSAGGDLSTRCTKMQGRRCVPVFRRAPKDRPGRPVRMRPA